MSGSWKYFCGFLLWPLRWCFGSFMDEVMTFKRLMKPLCILCVDEAWLHHCHHPVDGPPNHQHDRIMSHCGIIKGKNPFAGILTLLGFKRSVIIYSKSCFAFEFVLYYFTLFTWPAYYDLLHLVSAFWQLLVCLMSTCRAATNNYFHYPLIWLLFSQLMRRRRSFNLHYYYTLAIKNTTHLL